MTKPDLAAIKARWDEATDGPWFFQPWSSCPLPSGDYAESILMANASSDGELCRGLYDADGEAIAHAREDIPALLAYIEELEAQVERLQEESEQFQAAYETQVKLSMESNDRAANYKEALRIQTEQTIAAAKCSPSRLTELQLQAVLWERDELKAQVGRVRTALSNHPTCDKYDDNDAITCGWKRAVQDVQKAL